MKHKTNLAITSLKILRGTLNNLNNINILPLDSLPVSEEFPVVGFVPVSEPCPVSGCDASTDGIWLLLFPVVLPFSPVD